MSEVIFQDLFSLERIKLDIKKGTKDNVLKHLVSFFDINQEDKELLFDDILKREQDVSTGIGCGVAIPHGRLNNCKYPQIVFARLIEPISYSSIDGSMVSIIFMIMSQKGNPNSHLMILAGLAKILQNDAVVFVLKNSNNKKKIHEILSTVYEPN